MQDPGESHAEENHAKKLITPNVSDSFGIQRDWLL